MNNIRMRDTFSNKLKCLIMRIIVFYITCFVLILVSCSKVPSESDLKEEALADKILLRGLAGEVIYVPLDLDTRNCILKSENPEIVSCEFVEDCDLICVHMLGTGKTSISLLNVGGAEVAIIYVSVCYFSSSLIEEIAMHPAIKPEVFARVTDPRIKQFIEDELWAEIARAKKTFYTFDGIAKKFTMDITQLEEKYQGTYEWTIDSLILKYGDVTERYGFKKADKDCYIIQADKTTEYQHRYPNGGIISVTLSRVWYDWDSII